ncbi:MAG TPA: ABC transporter permease, partial [Solirubrobacterales bacterium]|nr:ABC transporter permease [Solirubrobacterales bacterium]
MATSWLQVPREWLESMGEIVRFCGAVMGLVFSGRVFKYFGEVLNQAGILILGSTTVIWGLVFVLGLQCGIEGAYFNRSVGAPAYAGVFAAWCDLREVIPYAFGYMMSAKVGTGIVAELGAMRISDEIDALEVMGVPPVPFLAATGQLRRQSLGHGDIAEVGVAAGIAVDPGLDPRVAPAVVLGGDRLGCAEDRRNAAGRGLTHLDDRPLLAGALFLPEDR